MDNSENDSTEPVNALCKNRAAPYDRLIDQEMWAFIDATNAYYPEDAVDLSIMEQRKLYNNMCQGFQSARPQGIETRDYTVGNSPVTVREYRADKADNEACVIYYHGGGFIVGDLESHDDVCAEICAGTGFTVISADYRLAPEHVHPASFEDAYTVFSEVAQSCRKRMILVGDSAGAGLAAAVAARARNGVQQPAGQVLVYPYLGGPLDSGSAIVHADAPMLKTRDLGFYHRMRLPSGPVESRDETFAPLWGKDYQFLPATIVLSAECDPLCDDGHLYTQAIKAAGGRANWIVEKGMVHGCLRARHMSKRANSAFGRMLEAIRMLGQGQWLY